MSREPRGAAKLGFPVWLAPGLLFYAFMAVALVGDSLSIQIHMEKDGRIVADGWTLSLVLDLLAGRLDARDVGSIASSIAAKSVEFVFGCWIGLIAWGFGSRKRSAATASYVVNLFQCVVGLAFFYYYPRDVEVMYLLFGSVLVFFACLQYWALARPSVRLWLRSYAVEFLAIPSAEPGVRRYVVWASVRKGLSSVILGFEVFMLALVGYGLVGELTEWAFEPREAGFEGALIRTMRPFLLLYMLFLPIVILYPTLAVVGLLWRRPPRILLLRPFHAAEVSNTLKDIVRDSIGYFAHVYTLSDADIRQPWYFRWPVALPQLWLLHFRAAHLKDARTVDRMEKKVRRTLLRNINWLASAGKLFTMTASDDAWKVSVVRLVSLADAVLFDISHRTENIDWELEQLRQRARSVIFVAKKSGVEGSVEFLKLHGLDCELGRNLFAYDEGGMALMDQFTERFAALLTNNRGQREVQAAPAL